MSGAARRPALRALGRVGRLALVALAVWSLARSVRWGDRVVVGVDGRELAGTALRAARDGAPAALQVGGEWRELTPEQAAGARVEPGLKTALGRLPSGRLALAEILYLFGLAIVALRWRALAAWMGTRLEVGQAWIAQMRSQTVGLILPGSVGGDVYRLAVATRAGSTLAGATLGVALDRAIGLWVLILGTSAVALVTGTRFLGQVPLLLAGGCAAALPFGAAGAYAVRYLPARWRERIGLDDLWARAVRAPRPLFAAAGLSALNTALQVGWVLLLVASFQRGALAYGEVAMAVALGFVANAVPILPGGAGVGDAAFVWLLGRAGVPAAPALAANLTMRLVVYGTAGAGALLFLRAGGAEERGIARRPSPPLPPQAPPS